MLVAVSVGHRMHKLVVVNVGLRVAEAHRDKCVGLGSTSSQR